MTGDELRQRKLLMVAAALGQNITDLWAVYQELFYEMDLTVPEVYDMMSGLLVEMEANLIDVLDQVSGQAYILTGIYEPLPLDGVEDFEASVLRDIDKLGVENLENYRVELD